MAASCRTKLRHKASGDIAPTSAIAKVVAGLQEWKEFLIAIIAGCAIALGVVFMSRKKEAL